MFETDFKQLIEILSTPRPNGSKALRATLQALTGWLDRRSIPYRLQEFRCYPYFMPNIGIWLILSRSLLALAIWLRWGWPALAIALLGLPGGLIDVLFGFPLVSWPGAMKAHNLLLEFGPQDAIQELVVSAHCDTKTEPLDHRQRMFFLRALPVGILLSLVLGLLGPLDAWLLASSSPWASLTYATGILLSLALLFLAFGLGGNLALGPFTRPQSLGVIDNGTACAILLSLAEKLQREELCVHHTRLTLALFTAEEANMQGSQAYIKSRTWPMPVANLNLEVMAQDGTYVYWEQDGTSLKPWPTDPETNRLLIEAVQSVTGLTPKPAGPVNSDSGSFLRNGLPASILGTYDRNLVDRGFHSPADNLARLVPVRLSEGRQILAEFIRRYDTLHEIPTTRIAEDEAEKFNH